MLLCGAIHIAQWQTSKELIVDANLLAQCEWTLTHNKSDSQVRQGGNLTRLLTPKETKNCLYGSTMYSSHLQEACSFVEV